MMWVEMLHEHEGHASFGWHGAQQLAECLKAPGRGADRDNRERGVTVPVAGTAVLLGYKPVFRLDSSGLRRLSLRLVSPGVGHRENVPLSSPHGEICTNQSFD